jgi:hypothetical protein
VVHDDDSRVAAANDFIPMLTCRGFTDTNGPERLTVLMRCDRAAQRGDDNKIEVGHPHHSGRGRGEELRGPVEELDGVREQVAVLDQWIDVLDGANLDTRLEHLEEKDYTRPAVEYRLRVPGTTFSQKTPASTTSGKTSTPGDQFFEVTEEALRRREGEAAQRSAPSGTYPARG